MKIIILGSGLLGVTTAYELAKRGFEVTVLDRKEASAAECSYANGGQLSYSTAEPWATPEVLKKLPKWLVHPDAPLVFRPRADLDMIKWGLRFLRNCTVERASINTVNLLRLGLYSRMEMHRIVQEIAITFDYTSKGILQLYGSDADFESAKKQMEFQAKFGCKQTILTANKCIELEPALAHTSRPIAGGIHAVMDEVGDAHIFCNALANYAAEKHGVKFLYGTTIKAIITEENRVFAVETNAGQMQADGFVMAMGSYSAIFMKRLGVKIPVYPMKGYSLTLNADEYTPQSSITDNAYKVVYTRIGSKLRIAGTAEFAGYNDKINESRIKPILRAAKSILPKVNWNQPVEKWACLRPSTPTGLPVLGPTPYVNLFLNTGHGTLGWTQAAGSASIVADIMQNKAPQILMNGMILER
ncbi:MAG: D-amino acid dehydrogenase [Alphaproteobacteria bacterium]